MSGLSGRRVRVHLCIDEGELPDEASAVMDVLAGMRLELDAGDEVDADIFVGVYGGRYGEIDLAQGLSRLERHYLVAGQRPRLVYVLPDSDQRDDHLSLLLRRIQADDLVSYRRVMGSQELAVLVADDLAMVLTEAFTTDARPDAGPTRAAPVPSRPGPRARIPASWHRLVGRDRESAEVCALLDEARLLTLTGPGGIGKSRLAIEVATRSEPVFTDGAWFVDLAGLRDPALVAPTVAHALGIRESAGALPVESLKSYLATMHALILLDSFESVIDAGPLLADLVSSAPSVSFLVTTRSVLRVRGEQVYVLPPLEVPAPGTADPASPALELFLERAQMANPTRILTTAEQNAAAEVCRRLDGVPLALELAAARTRLLAPSALLGRLENALDALGSGPQDLPERQRALRTTLDWDHALLTGDEQVVLRRLSVFPRHFTLEAAEQVMGSPGPDVFEGMDGLVGKSLVRTHEADQPGDPRFVMLQTVREYAHEHLEAAGESDPVHARHAAYVLARVELANQAEPREVEAWFAVLEHEHDDIRVALDWADRARDVDLLVRIAVALGSFWRSRCHFSEGRRWLDRALALTAGQRTPVRAELLNASGYLARARGDHDTADVQYREAMAIRTELGDQDKVAESLRLVGNVAYERGDLDGAEHWWRRSHAMLAELGDDDRLLGVLNNLGVMAHHRGDQDEAIRLFDESYEVGNRLGSTELQARAQMNMANAMASRGDLQQARVMATAAVVGYAALDDTWDLVDALDIMAGVVGREGDPVLSGWLFGAADALRTALGVRRPESEKAEHASVFRQSRSPDVEGFDSAFAKGATASVDEILARATDTGGAS